jgi:L-alanine-DL-glutamate epimerase-like enolase superfamily enzyme
MVPLVNTFELKTALEARAMDYVMPDVQRIGGVTGWLRAADHTVRCRKSVTSGQTRSA